MRVRIACIQMEPKVGDKAGNIARSIAYLEQAADNGAQLVVLPELCNSGYVFESMDEARALSEPFPGGETCNAWSEVAARRNLHIVAGVDECDGDTLYNSAVVIGPQGHIGTFRKVHLWDQENRFFTPGNLGFPVFDTPVGRLASMICYDGWFPESYRECALKGADIVCVPTNWVPINGQREDREAMANILTMAAAHSNSVFIACADRIGTERGQPFIGQSIIVSFTGWPIGGPAKPDQEEILYADADLSDPARRGAWNEFNKNPLGDRRPDEYDAMENTRTEQAA
jgi:N-carbamoylputrescine amidase